MLLRKIWCLLVFGFYSTFAVSEFLPNPNYISYNTQDGLSNSMVYAITQDSDGFMWFGTEDGLNRFDGTVFTTYRYDPKDSRTLAGNKVNHLYVADDNSLWISTHNGLSKYNPTSDTFTNFNVSNGLSHNNVRAVLKVDNNLWVATDNGLNVIDLKSNQVSTFPINTNGSGTSHKWIRALTKQDDFVWIATWGGGLNRYDLTAGRFEYYNYDEEDDSSVSSNTIHSLYATEHNELWLGTINAGVNRYRNGCNCFERFILNPTFSDTTAAAFAEVDGVLWIATNAGLSRYLFESGTFDNYSLLKAHELGNVTRDIRSLFVSNDGTIWFGSFQMGVSTITPKGFVFQTYQYSEEASNSLKSDDINSLLVEDDYMWTGAVGGLYRYPISSNGTLGEAQLVLDSFALKIEPASDGSYWFATNDGLYHLDSSLNLISHNDHSKLIPDSANEGAVLDVIETTKGEIFVANWRGGITQLINEHSGKFKQVALKGDTRGVNANSSVYALAENDNEQIWIGTRDGINRYDIASDKVKHYSLQFNKNQPQVVVYYIYIQSGELLIGTSNGLYEYDNNSDSFHHYPLQLKSNYIQAITLESDGVYWLSTFNGLYRWNKTTNEVDSYFKGDGLQSSEFNTKGVAAAPDGSLFFSGIDGVTRILPDKLIIEAKHQPLRWLYNGALVIDEFNLEFAEGTNSISLRYFISDYKQPERIQFRYKINQGDWIANDSSRIIQLTGLDSGLYSIDLQYKADNHWQDADGVAHVTVIPPFYESVLAKVFYLLVLVLMGYGYYRYRTQAIILKQAELQRVIDEKTAELASTLEQKNQLFANISHELRTPITLINAPIEQLAQQSNLTEQQKKLISLAQNNGKRLFGLVERILHLSKVEQKQKLIEPINIDDLLIRYVIAFEPLMQQKQIEFQQHLNSHTLVQADKEDLVSILENLLSNALKYTSAGGWVKLHSLVLNGEYQLIIENQHSGLSKDQITKIFDRFERLGQSDSEQGFGLGLSLVKDICNQNGWNIKCSCKTGSIIFTLTINDFVIESSKTSPAQRQIIELGLGKSQSSDKERQSVLIVEDNDELRGFLVDLLSSDYKVSNAANGLKGLGLAIDNMPDLVISDVMMPEMDGFSLVKGLAEHDNTSHIPAILLTAKTEEESKLKGLELGAVDYIAKPFEARQLLLKIKNTLERQKLRFKTQQSQDAPIENIVSERDQKFIERLEQLVEKNYADNEFNVEKLVGSVAMSERQLQRKLKAIFNQTPAEYIRNFRLLKAKQLLLEGKSISLTSDLVGFNSSSYFSRSFKTAFGQSPKEFITQSPK